MRKVTAILPLATTEAYKGCPVAAESCSFEEIVKMIHNYDKNKIEEYLDGVIFNWKSFDAMQKYYRCISNKI